MDCSFKGYYVFQAQFLRQTLQRFAFRSITHYRDTELLRRQTGLLEQRSSLALQARSVFVGQLFGRHNDHRDLAAEAVGVDIPIEVASDAEIVRAAELACSAIDTARTIQAIAEGEPKPPPIQPSRTLSPLAQARRQFQTAAPVFTSAAPRTQVAPTAPRPLAKPKTKIAPAIIIGGSAVAALFLLVR